MALVNDKAVFEISVKGEQTGKVYSGKFVMRLFLTLKQRGQVAVEYSKRDMGNDLDAGMSQLNRTICEFQAMLEDCPEWFKGEKAWELEDFQPIISIREELEAAQKEHSEKINA